MNIHDSPHFAARTRCFGAERAAKPQLAVAIPARNEEDRIGRCLTSLIAQRNIALRDIEVIVLLNNCTDDTLDAIETLSPALPFPLTVASVDLPAGYANAGWARRLAMQRASALLDDGGLLLTMDADCFADDDWVAQTRAEFAGQVDLVAGYVTADWSELSLLPPDVLAQGALEWEYQGLSAELEAKVDPLTHDPWPRHNQNCGASLAIRNGIYRKIGGLPPLPVGEDRALCEAVRMIDGHIRHSLKAHVTASARTIGRASGGMADALRTRGSNAYLCDEILEPSFDLLRRNGWRAGARAAWKQGCLGAWLDKKQIYLGPSMMLGGTFGQAWRFVENIEPVLARKRLRSSDLQIEIRRIRRLLVQFH